MSAYCGEFSRCDLGHPLVVVSSGKAVHVWPEDIGEHLPEGWREEEDA